MKIFLSLGANTGHRAEAIRQATRLIPLENKRLSKLYEAQPWRCPEGTPGFVNAVLAGETDFLPEDLLGRLQAIEGQLGRKKERGSVAPYAPRSIDIDILFYDDLILALPELTIPHPRIATRRFVLMPMVDVAATLIHPVLRKSMQELLKECPDNSIVRPLYDNS